MDDARVANRYPMAAYLYVLHLDGPSLAWEYLRRNPDYRRDWHQRRRRPRQAQRWGLRLLENPDLDARDAHPDWFPDPDGVVQVHADPDPPPEAPPFRLWELPGDKRLLHDGRRLLLSSRRAGRVLRLACTLDLEDGQAYAYAVRAGRRFRLRWRAAEAELVQLHTPCDCDGRALDRPGRTAWLHLQTLQALDAVQAGASQRRVAEIVFGTADVAARWHSDGELRARVRRLIRRGLRLMQDGYRRLLHPESRRKGRSARRGERP